MLKVHFTTFAPALNRSFHDTKIVATIADFRLYAFALFHGNWTIDKVETI